MEQQWQCRDFEAWHDTMPGTEPTVHVHGYVDTPTDGWSARLEYAEPQGINPRVLELELKVEEPEGAAPDVLSELEVKFERASEEGYDQVHVRGCGTFEVRPVS